jgi:hypothetical protein
MQQFRINSPFTVEYPSPIKVDDKMEGAIEKRKCLSEDQNPA